MRCEPYTRIGCACQSPCGVQQWWQEGGYAYYAPFSSIASTLPTPTLGIIGAALSVITDVPALTTFRYGLTESGQLIVQYGRGKGGQAVIEDYYYEESTAGITALQQVANDNAPALSIAV